MNVPTKRTVVSCTAGQAGCDRHGDDRSGPILVAEEEETLQMHP
jgi:hypothetical protein